MYFVLFKKIVKLFFGSLEAVFTPAGSGIPRVSKLYLALVAANVSLTTLSGTFCLANWKAEDFGSISEPIAFCVSGFRGLFQIILFYYHRLEFKNLIHSMIEARQKSFSSNEKRQMTLKFCRKDVRISVVFIILCGGDIAFILIGSFFASSSRYNLPFNCNIFFLNVEGNPVNFAINFIFQLFIVIFGSIFFTSRFMLTLILMNQSCFVVESAILKINQIDHENKKEQSQFKKFLIEVVEETGEVIAWQNAVRKFLSKFFLADLTLLAAVFCLYLYSMMISDSGNFQALSPLIIELFVIFQLCRMGSKFNSKLAKLSASIYAQNWHLLSICHQRDLKLILQMSQQIKGFDGVFKTVDLATLQKILEFAYSMLMLLKSVK